MEKIKVNENCIGCGACTAIAPDYFEFNDEGYAKPIKEEVEEITNQFDNMGGMRGKNGEKFPQNGKMPQFDGSMTPPSGEKPQFDENMTPPSGENPFKNGETPEDFDMFNQNNNNQTNDTNATQDTK